MGRPWRERRWAYRLHFLLHLRRAEARYCVDLDDAGSVAAPVHGCRDHPLARKVEAPLPYSGSPVSTLSFFAQCQQGRLP